MRRIPYLYIPCRSNIYYIFHTINPHLFSEWVDKRRNKGMFFTCHFCWWAWRLKEGKLIPKEIVFTFILLKNERINWGMSGLKFSISPKLRFVQRPKEVQLSFLPNELSNFISSLKQLHWNATLPILSSKVERQLEGRTPNFPESQGVWMFFPGGFSVEEVSRH